MIKPFTLYGLDFNSRRVREGSIHEIIDGILSPIERLIRALSDLQVRQAQGVDLVLTECCSCLRAVPSHRGYLRKRSGTPPLEDLEFQDVKGFVAVAS